MTATCPAGCGTDTTDGLLCVTCTARLERDLGDVPALVHDLDVTISRQARIGTSGKGGPAHERTPVHLGAIEAADVLTNTLTTWARDVDGYAWPWARMSHPTLAAQVVLMNHIPAIRRHPAAAELVDEVSDAIKQARRVVDRPADRIYLGVCHYIDGEVECFQELFARPGAHEVTCPTCGIEHPVAERRAWLLRRAEDMLLTVREAAQMVGEVGQIKVTEAAIRGYLHRKRIAYRPGTTTIRLGDLLAVVVDEGERRTA